MFNKKSAIAIVATGLLDKIILERHLINIIPKNRQYTLQEAKKLTGYNFLSFRDYVKSDLFTINGTNIKITDDCQLLSEKSKIYCEILIKKLVFPSKYKHNEYIYNVGRLFNNSYYTQEEKSFIDLMLDKLFCTMNNNATELISINNPMKYNILNNNVFLNTARDIFNSTIHNTLNKRNNIINNVILQCSLDTNVNTLIKNFLTLCIYKFNDAITKLILLFKLNKAYPNFINDIS